MFFRKSSSVSARLVQRVALLSLIAILGLMAAIGVGILSTRQSIQAQFNDASLTASRTFDQFMLDIESDLLATSDSLATTADIGDVFRRLLARQLPILDLLLLNPQGDVLVQEHRVGREEETNLVAQPWLASVQAGEVYVGPIDFSEVSVPSVEIAVPVRDEVGRFAGTLLARVDLTSLWNIALSLRVGETGYVYITDDTGQLIAYRNLQVLQSGADLQALVGYAPQAIVQSGLSAYTGLSGEFVLGSGVPLTVVPWFAIVEQDFSEAVGPFWWRLGVLIAGLVLVGGLVYDFVRFTRRQVVQPLTLLREGVDVVTEGNLEHTINLQTEDEFGTLAGAFNAMAAQLRQLIDTLEDRIFDRTRALETSVEISRQLTTILNLEELLQYVVNRIQTEFKFYHTHVYLVEEETGDLVMAEGSGQAGRQLKKEGHRLSAGDGIVGTVASTSQHFLSNNVEDVLNFVPNPLLPRTKSELAVPLRKGDQVLGVLDIQSEQVNRFTTSDVSLMQAIADQTAIAIDNARLVAQTQNALTQVERLNRRLTLEAWEQFGEDITTSGYRFVQQHRARVSPASDAWLPPMDQAAIKKQLVKLTHPGNGEPPRAELAIPLILRGEVIGILGAKREQASDWQEEELAAVESIANQVALALENARLAKEQEKTILHLKEVDRLKSDFLTSMSHELRTPLNSIIGFADVLLQGIDGELNEMAMNDIRLIHSSGQHLLALINDVLDLAKIEAGKMELVQVPIDVSTAVQEVLATSTSLLKNKPVELVVDVADDLPMIYADKLRFNQVFLNLVSNAAKFTDEGTITIRARLLDRFPGQLCISVTDTGVGIEPGKVDTVFDRFRQVDSSTTRKYGGSGLGLAICKQLVEMHGGEVGVESELNAGSTFYFTVPLVSSISEDESPTSVGAPN